MATWGDSMDDEQWSMTPSGRQEFKVSVSEWLLNSTSAADLDYDSHTPLLIEVHANQYSGSRMRAMNRNPETVKEAAETGGKRDRRRTRPVVQPIHRPHQRTQALHRERHRPVQLFLLAPDVLQNPHNLQVDTQKVEKEAGPPRARRP